MPQSTTSAAVTHYENFPVASWLCPRHLRAPIAAIYHFARTADDIADEGADGAQNRLDELAAYRRELHAVATGAALTDSRWPAVFAPLASQWQACALPLAPFDDLLSAFEQDVRMTQASAAYANWSALLDYCRLSANPVGRLLLHLYDVGDGQALQESDAICSALQLINFWQDLSVDIGRGRYYLPLADCAEHGLTISEPAAQFPRLQADVHSRPLLATLAARSRALMLDGAPLVHRIPGRAGWELRAVVQGGLRILDKIEALGPQVLDQRPRLGKADWPLVGWRMLWM